MSAKDGKQQRVIGSAENSSRISVENQKEKSTASICSYILFVFLSISLFFALGTLSIALNENNTYSVGAEPKPTPIYDDASMKSPPPIQEPSQKENNRKAEKLIEKPPSTTTQEIKDNKPIIEKASHEFERTDKKETVGNSEKLNAEIGKQKSEPVETKKDEQKTKQAESQEQTKANESQPKAAANDQKKAQGKDDPKKIQGKADPSKPLPEKTETGQDRKNLDSEKDSPKVEPKQGVKKPETKLDTQKTDPKKVPQKEGDKTQKIPAKSTQPEPVKSKKTVTESDQKRTSSQEVKDKKDPKLTEVKSKKAATDEPKPSYKPDPKLDEGKEPSSDANKRKRRDTPPTKEEREELMQMYTIVEGLADEILKEDPKNDVIKQLMPHFESTLKDIEEGRIAGIKEGLLHIKKLLEDLKQRLKEVEEEKIQSKDSAKPEEKDDKGNKPVDEVIPDPMYIAPREAQPPAAREPAVLEEDPKRAGRYNLETAYSKIEKEPKEAMDLFVKYLEQNPESPEAMLGHAKSLDKLAEIEKSNARLEQAIYAYRAIVDLAFRNKEKVPDELLRTAGLTCAERMGFRGFQSKSVRVLQQLIDFFPNDVELQNKLGVQLLMMNQPKAAQEVFRKVLSVASNDGFAQAHYGFALKTEDQNYSEAIKYLTLGIESGAEGTKDGRFYFQLGDSYLRLGKNDKAYEVFEKGAKEGLFLNKYQRSLYNIDRLKSQPIWSLEETTYQVFFKNLENNWQKIRDEGMKVLSMEGPNGFLREKENLSDTGDWKQFELYARGKKVTKNCEKTPFTCGLIDKFAAAAGCKRGQVKFSVMEAGTHVWPHTGPTNCRLRGHLGLITPEGPSLRVADKTLTWKEGKVIVFDDSWEHEVWHRGTSPRLILIVDVWHPEITESERRSLTPL